MSDPSNASPTDSVKDSSGRPSRPAPSLLRAWADILLWAGLAFVLNLVNTYAGNWLRLPAPGTLASDLIAVPYLLLLLLALIQLAMASARLAVSAGFALLAGTVLALPSLTRLVLFALSVVRPQWGDLQDQFLSVSASLPPGINQFLNSFIGPIGLTLLGAGIGRIIKHPNTLLAGAGFAVFFDIVAVTVGSVALLLQANSGLIAAVSVGAGAPPFQGGLPLRHSVHIIEPLSSVTIGPADVMFMAVFLSAVNRLGMQVRTTYIAMFSLLGLSLALVQTTAAPIPALAPMGVAVLVANRMHAAFTRQERRDLKIGGVFALFCAMLMVVGARMVVPPPPPPPMGLQYSLEGPPFTMHVMAVVPGSRAAESGIRPGDLVSSIGNLRVQSASVDQLTAALTAARSNGATIEVVRPGQAAPLRVVLPAAPGRR